MMDGLLVVCLTGICMSPDPLSLYASRSPHAPASPSEGAPTSPIPSASTLLSDDTSAARESSAAAVIAAPAPIERDDAPTAGGAGAVMSRATVAMLVKGKLDGVRRCYEKGLADDPTFGGTVEMGWKIDVAGRVTSTNVVTATDRNPVVETLGHVVWSRRVIELAHRPLLEVDHREATAPLPFVGADP